MPDPDKTSGWHMHQKTPYKFNAGNGQFLPLSFFPVILNGKSNIFIIHMDDENVTFSVKDYRKEGQWKELTISGIEFIRRFLMHVPPRRFVRIRHYGLLCSRSKHKKLTLCRNLLGCKKYLSKLRAKEMPEILKQLYGINICVCKSCGGHLGKPQLRIPQRC